MDAHVRRRWAVAMEKATAGSARATDGPLGRWSASGERRCGFKDCGGYREGAQRHSWRAGGGGNDAGKTHLLNVSGRRCGCLGRHRRGWSRSWGCRELRRGRRVAAGVRMREGQGREGGTASERDGESDVRAATAAGEAAALKGSKRTASRVAGAVGKFEPGGQVVCGGRTKRDSVVNKILRLRMVPLLTRLLTLRRPSRQISLQKALPRPGGLAPSCSQTALCCLFHGQRAAVVLSLHHYASAPPPPLQGLLRHSSPWSSFCLPLHSHSRQACQLCNQCPSTPR